MTPPFCLSATSISSSMLRLTFASDRAAECEAMIGAFESATACIIDPFDGWETSTITPHLFISAITCFPSGLNPPYSH